MKKQFLLTTITLLLALSSQAQQIESLAGGKNGKVRVGGFGAPTVKYTRFNDEDALLLGGYAGVMLNSKLMLGAGAYALVNNIEAPTPATAAQRYWNMWYTGFVPEYTIKSNKLFHGAIGVLIGGGGVFTSERFNHSFDNDRETYDDSGFFVLEPHANLEMNITRFLRIGIGGSYRHISGSNSPGITDGKMSAFAGSFTLKAGRF